MAFQDFDVISERRRNEQKQKMKKMIIIGVVSTILLAGLIAAAFFIVTGVANKDKKSPPPSSSSSNGGKNIAHSERLVQLVCSNANYKEKCEGPLREAASQDPEIAKNPKEFIKVYVKHAQDEVDKAFNHTMSIKFESEAEQGAFDDCKKLFDNAKTDLDSSITELTNNDFKVLARKVPDFNSWLSAVISYQQTCIDGFPEGQTKTDLQNMMTNSREIVSNSLAVVSQIGTLVTAFTALAGGRLLEEKKSDYSPLDFLDKVDGLPSWVDAKDRRVLKAADNRPTPNVTVAKDGSGDFKTISEALEKIPPKFEGRYVVYVKEGVYEEIVTITTKMQNVTMYGDGSQKSIITGSKNFRDGTRTFQTATFVVEGDGFIGKAMGFRNTAGPEGHQAVATRVQADRVVFVNCRFEGYQDTLYVQAHRQFYRSCIVSGTIDFIFGDAAAVFQNCIMQVRRPMDNQQNMVTAQGRMDPKQTTGIVLQKCIIRADESLVPVKGKIRSYLGRPWKEYSRTIVMESEIGDLIDPEGWTAWAGTFALDTLYYAEYNNNGAGAKTDQRIKWAGYRGVISKQEASKFTVGIFLKGTWVQGTGVPSVQGFYSN